MTTVETHAQQTLRSGFRYFNKFMMLLWRLGLGGWVNAWPEVGGRIMVLAHIGRKSGLRRYTPVNFAAIDGTVYCVAGFGHTADWYRNLCTYPNVEVWLPQGWWKGIAEDITASQDALPKIRRVLINSGFAAPLAGVHPRIMSDAALAEATREYRLIRIRLSQACTGKGGPGDLAWVWPLATLILLPLVLWRQRIGNRTVKQNR